METSAPAPSASSGYPRVASPIHTILVLAAIGSWAIGHRVFADQLSATANPNRILFYGVTVLYEWLLFVLVVAAVRRSGASVITVLGDHWHSVRQVLRDFGVAAGFWIVAAMLLWIFGLLLRTATLGRNVSMLKPTGPKHAQEGDGAEAPASPMLATDASVLTIVSDSGPKETHA